MSDQQQKVPQVKTHPCPPVFCTSTHAPAMPSNAQALPFTTRPNPLFHDAPSVKM